MHGVNVLGQTPTNGRVDPRLMRSVCGEFVTGVTVVTSSTSEGPVGITINSFTSVSLYPPLVLFCIHEQSTILSTIQTSAVFAVNILAEDQLELCRTFARQATAQFTNVRSRPGLSGAPILTDALAYLDCGVIARHRAGDHWIVVGRVIDTDMLRAGNPLTFFRSSHPRLEASK
jgi:flavin reductase (DIM6/NTAB) family NADH-FMN oxidoreductase RutF